MAIKTRWNTEDAPDWVKERLEEGDAHEEDGEIVLDVEGMKPKEKVDEFRTRNIKLQKQLEDLEKSMEGGLSPSEARRQQEELQSLRDRLEAGEDDERVQELLEKRLATVKVGDREIKVERRHRAALEAQAKALEAAAQEHAEQLTAVSQELAKERIEGGARDAMATLGGFKPGATDDVVRYVRDTFRMGPDHQPYIPDPDAPPPENGESPAPLVGEDGKPVTIESHLKAKIADGAKNGVWVEDPSGPKKPPKPGHKSREGEVHGLSRTARGLKERRAAS